MCLERSASCYLKLRIFTKGLYGPDEVVHHQEDLQLAMIYCDGEHGRGHWTRKAGIQRILYLRCFQNCPRGGTLLRLNVTLIQCSLR